MACPSKMNFFKTPYSVYASREYSQAYKTFSKAHIPKPLFVTNKPKKACTNAAWHRKQTQSRA